MEKKVDYLIVGGGLAGTCLALTLHARKKKVVLIDQPSETSASRVAAGLFNPVTGKLAGLTWKASELFPRLHQFYRLAEGVTGGSFFYPKPIYRPFRGVQEEAAWKEKAADPAVAPFVNRVFSASRFGHDVNDDIGGLLLAQSGYLDTNAFLDAVAQWLDREGAWRREDFDPAKLDLTGSAVQYAGITATAIILCQGIHALDNPLTHWLPLRPLKGEVLKISAELDEERIYNRGVFLVRDTPGGWKVGATHVHHAQPGVTALGRQELEGKLSALLRKPFTTTGQGWGVRPTVPDRRPILGPHPEHKSVIIFNGLGTKGVSLAPYFAGQLGDWLLEKADLNPEVIISRFYSLYFKSQKTV